MQTRPLGFPRYCETLVITELEYPPDGIPADPLAVISCDPGGAELCRARPRHLVRSLYDERDVYVCPDHLDGRTPLASFPIFRD